MISRRTFIKNGLAVPLAAVFRHGQNQTADFVQVIWCGALQPHSIQVNAQITFDSPAVRLLVSTQPNFSQPLFSPFQSADRNTNNRMVALPVSGLQPGTAYYYAVEADGQLDTGHNGRFTTPPDGPFSFTFACASCAQTGSNSPVFDTIRSHNPLFYINMGDLHYEDIGVNDRGRFRQAYERVLSQPRQAALYRALPIATMWDDHDYGPNDSDKNAPGREAARLTYQEYVPHYPLAIGSGNVPIYQAFSIGRARFIMTDTRSERSPNSTPDSAAKSILGDEQKAWFKQQLLAANGVFPLIFWISTSPWMADLPGSGNDSWAGYPTERREIADFIAAHAIQGLIMLSGDVHMLAIEDGRNNRYATNAARGFPIMQAAPLDRNNPSDLPDNTYSEGQFPGREQFGLVTIEDDGGPEIRIRFSGRDVADQELVYLDMTIPPGPRLETTPQALNFLRIPGGQEILNLPLKISNAGFKEMDWTITPVTPTPWLTLSKASGTAKAGEDQEINVKVSAANLFFGVYKVQLRVTAPGATYAPQLIPVTFLYTDTAPEFLPAVFGR